MDIISLILNSKFENKYVLLPQSNNEKNYVFSVEMKDEINNILCSKEICFFIHGPSSDESYQFKISDEKYVFSFVDEYENYVLASHIMNEVNEHKFKSEEELFRKILYVLNNNSVNNKDNSSKIIRQFSEILNSPKVLTNPQEFLGPNTDKLLDFWLKIEKLTQEQLKTVKVRFDAFHNDNYSEWDEATDLALAASEEVVRGFYASHAGWAAWDVTKSETARWATREILGNVENPTFLKMFDNL
jgi:hypothetical protein